MQIKKEMAGQTLNVAHGNTFPNQTKEQYLSFFIDLWQIENLKIVIDLDTLGAPILLSIT